MEDKLKIIHIISNLSLGGAQTLLLDILNCIKIKANIEITVITLDSGEFIKKYEESGIRVIDLKQKGLINSKTLSKLKTILKEINPDIVHTHLLKADFYGRIAAKQVGVPVIYSTCHNYSSHHKGADINKKSVFDRIDDFVISYSKSNLIAISEVVKKYLLNRNADYKNITEVIYNGLNIEKEKYILDENDILEFRKKLNLYKEDFVILISGRLEIQKGHKFFLESIKDFLKDKKNVKVLILGDGNLKAEIENIINQNEIHDYVKMLGFQKETEKFIEASDLVCVPSLWEGFGLVIIEAMIKKKIVLASDVGGIPEIVENNKTGFLFKSLDKQDLLEKINYVISGSDNLEQIRTYALELVKNKFDIQKTSELYYQSYINKITSNY